MTVTTVVGEECKIDPNKVWTFYSDRLECNRATELKDDLCQIRSALPTVVECTADPFGISSTIPAESWSFQCTSDSHWKVDIKVVCPEGSDPCGNYTDQCRILFDMSSGSIFVFAILPLLAIGSLFVCFVIGLMILFGQNDTCYPHLVIEHGKLRLHIKPKKK